ncbi:MAG: CcmD family protein [Dehalococcoidia bacterium]
MRYIEPLINYSFLKNIVAILFVIFMFFITQDIIFSSDGGAGAANGQIIIKESNSNLGYLFAVFFVTWIAFFGYLFFISKKQQNIIRDIKELENTISNNKS